MDVEQFYDEDTDETKERIVLYSHADYADTTYDLEFIINLKESTDIQNKKLRAAMQIDSLDIEGMNNSNQGAKIEFKLVEEDGSLTQIEVKEGFETPGILEKNEFVHEKPGSPYVKNEIEDILLDVSGKVSESITNNDSDIMIIASSYESPTGKNADDLEITIDGTGDIHIFVEELNISNLKIINDNLSENTGKVNIYVLDEMYIEGDINKHLYDSLADPDRFFNYNPLNIFYYGDNDVFFGINKPGDLFLYGNLVIVESGIYRNRGNFTLYGDLMVGGETVFLQPSGNEQIYI